MCGWAGAQRGAAASGHIFHGCRCWDARARASFGSFREGGNTTAAAARVHCADAWLGRCMPSNLMSKAVSTRVRCTRARCLAAHSTRSVIKGAWPAWRGLITRAWQNRAGNTLSRATVPLIRLAVLAAMSRRSRGGRTQHLARMYHQREGVSRLLGYYCFSNKSGGAHDESNQPCRRCMFTVQSRHLPQRWWGTAHTA